MLPFWQGMMVCEKRVVWVEKKIYLRREINLTVIRPIRPIWREERYV